MKTIAELTNAELVEGGTQFNQMALLAEVMRRITTGKLTEAEVARLQREQFLPSFNNCMDQWKAGTLFRAQRFGFMSMLTAHEKDMINDTKEWDKVNSLALKSGENTKPAWGELVSFNMVRIQLAPAVRKEFLDKDGNPKNLHDLEPKRQAFFKGLRDTYQHFTQLYNWADDNDQQGAK